NPTSGRRYGRALAPFFQQLEVPVQSFTIYPYQKNTLQGKRGLKIHIEAQAFTYMNGIPVSEPVEIEFKEIYSKSEIIRENLFTTFNGKLQEWGAMVYLNATSFGENVTIRPSLPITIELPRSQNQQLGPMRVYNGQRYGSNHINWLENDYSSLHKIGVVGKINHKTTLQMIRNSRSGRRLLGNYLFRTTRLGWINCTRSLEVKNERTTLKVKEDTDALIDIKLVFKKKNTVVPLTKFNGQFIASNLPVGEKAYLVGLGQLKEELYMAVKEIVINPNQQESLDFKLMTPGMIKKKLKSIN
ncbi:MAG: hypothetical protein AAGD05_19645, partial [Bacteroidota bacterium]